MAFYTCTGCWLGVGGEKLERRLVDLSVTRDLARLEELIARYAELEGAAPKTTAWKSTVPSCPS